MSDLPAERLAVYESVFSYTGVDYFGPIISKQSKKTRTKSGQSKCYGVVFTYLTTRAVHLEVAEDLSTDSFILALRRFIARLGEPKAMWSYNDTNFVDTNKEPKTILSELSQSKISVTLINQKKAWKFNPPSSLWMGGSWGSIVKITKRCLTKLTKDKPMTYETLVTFLTKIEATLNSRPLTQITDDLHAFNELTPNHFILGKQALYFSPDTTKDNHVTSIARWKAVQVLTKMFWKRFILEYLSTLQTCKKWNKVQGNLKQKQFWSEKTAFFDHIGQ